ncbi:MAG: site-specific integrase [Bacteroidales bacterium]|nr:site-specific integrase [Bacteroidales bacterium]
MRNITSNCCLRPGSGDTQKIYIRVTIDRKSKMYSTGISTPPDCWDQKKQRITARDPEAAPKNAALEKLHYKAKNIIYDLLRDQDSPAGFPDFERLFVVAKDKKKALLIDFMARFIKEKTGVFEANTIKRYNNAMNKIKEFRPGALLSDVNYNFLAAFENYCRHEKNNKHNTVAKEIKIIKTIFSEAQKRGMISGATKLNYQINYKDVNKDFLTVTELKTVAGLIDKNVSDTIKRVLYPFIFSCFTGLRLSDISRLKLSDFKDDYSYVDIITVKTKDRLFVPVNAPTRALIFKYMDYNKKISAPENSDALFFNMYSEQYGRDVLQTAVTAVGINKKITFHSGRYTFATICNSLGIPIEITSRLLSHKSLKMTLKYAKLTDQVLISNAEKWDALF